MSDVHHIEAIVLLSEKALSNHADNWNEQAGRYRALLSESLPYLRQLLEELKAKHEVTA